MRKLILLYCFISYMSHLPAQSYVGVKFSNNVNSFPVTGIPKIFYAAFHPGICITLEGRLNTKEKNQFLNELNLGGFYHRFFQVGIQLADLVKYQYAFSPRYSVFTGIGIGYMHSFYRYDIFRLNSNADYEHISSWRGRPQFMGAFAIGTTIGLLKEDPQRLRLSVEFRSWVHGIFAQSYVPLVPYNSLLAGIAFRLHHTSAAPVTETQQQ